MLNEYPTATFYKGQRPWHIPCDIAFPSATQNELNLEEAQALIGNGVKAVVEGANMPTELPGVHAFQEADVLFAPAKAANAGGVAVSGMEQSQNSLRLSWSRAEVDSKLKGVMNSIHEKCVEYGSVSKDLPVDYVRGANIGGFVKVADAMLAYGLV